MTKTHTLHQKSANCQPKNEQRSIQALKKKISELEKENFKLKSIIENLPGDIYWKNKEFIWSGVNKRGATSLKKMAIIKDESEVIGKSDYDLFEKETADEYRKNDLEVSAQRMEISREESILLPNGEKLVQISTKIPLFDNKGNVIGIVGNTVDITKLKKMEHNLILAKEEAEAANYIMTELIANLGHDLATPISDVGSVAQMLLFHADEYPELKELFEILSIRCDDCVKIRQKFIDATSFSKLDVKLEKFSISVELLKLVKELESLIGLKNLKLAIYPLKPFKEDFIETDRDKFLTVLRELISNAIQFTDEGNISITILKSKGNFHIEVTDTGIGIPSDKFEFIFKQYTKLSRSNKYGAIFKGVGAGLYLVRILVNILGGTTSVKSELGKGSTFTFSVPEYFSNK